MAKAELGHRLWQGLFLLSFIITVIIMSLWGDTWTEEKGDWFNLYWIVPLWIIPFILLIIALRRDKKSE